MTLVDLMENDWLTPETRAVIIEFVLYNPNSNLFAVSSMTFEFLPTGCKLLLPGEHNSSHCFFFLMLLDVFDGQYPVQSKVSSESDAVISYRFIIIVAVIPVYKMDLIRLDRYIGSFMITVMVSEILTFIYIIYYIYREVKVFKVQGKKYFNVG